MIANCKLAEIYLTSRLILDSLHDLLLATPSQTPSYTYFQGFPELEILAAVLLGAKLLYPCLSESSSSASKFKLLDQWVSELRNTGLNRSDNNNNNNNCNKEEDDDDIVNDWTPEKVDRFIETFKKRHAGRSDEEVLKAAKKHNQYRFISKNVLDLFKKVEDSVSIEEIEYYKEEQGKKERVKKDDQIEMGKYYAILEHSKRYFAITPDGNMLENFSKTNTKADHPKGIDALVFRACELFKYSRRMVYMALASMEATVKDTFPKDEEE